MAVSVVVVWTEIATGVFFVVRRPVFGLVERLLYVASFAWLGLAVVDVMLVRG